VDVVWTQLSSWEERCGVVRPPTAPLPGRLVGAPL